MDIQDVLNKKIVITDVVDNYDTKDDIKLCDPRMIKPFGVFDKKTKKYYVFQQFNKFIVNKKNIKIVSSNSIALSLNIYSKSIDKSKLLRKEISSLINHTDQIMDKNNIIFYDYYEEIQKAIIFLYRAIETFANANIPKDYQYSKKDNKNITCIYGKDEIIRWLPTSEKISDILPSILKIKSPKNNSVWSDFKKLEHIRNEIIHYKIDEEDELLSILLNQTIFTYCESTIKLLDLFISTDTKNIIFPFGFSNSEIESFKINDISKVLREEI